MAKLFKIDGTIETVELRDAAHMNELIGDWWLADDVKHRHALVTDDTAIAKAKPVNANASALIGREVRGNAVWILRSKMHRAILGMSASGN